MIAYFISLFILWPLGCSIYLTLFNKKPSLAVLLSIILMLAIHALMISAYEYHRIAEIQDDITLIRMNLNADQIVYYMDAEWGR